MKKIVFTLLACWMAGQAFAADSPWLTSLPLALDQAKKEHKLVLMDFTGSDWCPPCKRLEEETFSKSEFLDYAKKNLVLVQVDFPAQKPQSAALKDANNALQEKYSVEGYPTVIVLAGDAKVLWRQTGYVEGGPEGLIAKINDAKPK